MLSNTSPVEASPNRKSSLAMRGHRFGLATFRTQRLGPLFFYNNLLEHLFRRRIIEEVGLYCFRGWVVFGVLIELFFFHNPHSTPNQALYEQKGRGTPTTPLKPPIPAAKAARGSLFGPIRGCRSGFRPSGRADARTISCRKCDMRLFFVLFTRWKISARVAIRIHFVPSAQWFGECARWKKSGREAAMGASRLVR